MIAPRRLQSKIKSPDNLKRTLSRVRKGKPVVFTNGCFDLLHKGHVAYLQEARRQGRLLVVALNSDASVKRLKGPTRPINSLDARLEVVAALESVDFVTWFDDNDPVQTILKLKPDVLVKGGDWKPESILGSKEVFSWGGKVKSLSFVKGHSTTSMIRKAAAIKR